MLDLTQPDPRTASYSDAACRHRPPGLETNNTQEKAPHEAALHISLLAAASLLTFTLDGPCQAATEAPSADKATSYSEEDKDLLDTAQGLFQALPDAAAMQKLRPFTDAQVRLGQQL